MSADLPTFAVVGAVNHGKSSVVAALAEDDRVRVSAMPGETVANQRFGLRDLLCFVDTPGFQNARKALAELEQDQAADDPLAPFRRFIDRHRDDPAFEAECRLLQPVVDGAGILYVVDGLRPVRDINLCEMEILRRTGAPRLAIVNRTGDDDHADAWRGRLNQHFNLVREFDAHRATFADRKDLVESLAIIERGWKDRLGRAMQAMEDDRRQRVVEAAGLIVELLVDAVGHREKAHVEATGDDATRRAQADALRRRYMDRIAALERGAHRRIIALYAHRRVTPEALPDHVLGGDLFGEETWRLFGLGMRQLVGLSAVAGGVAGAAVDAATLGHSLGIGAAIGAATGAGGAYVLGRRRPEISIGWPAGAKWMASFGGSSALRFGGADVVVGPYRAENFPWILLDRALCVFAIVSTRSHARRDEVVADIEHVLAQLASLALSVSQWSGDERAACQKVFRALRAGDGADAARTTVLRTTVEDALDRVAAQEAPLGRALDART